MSASAFSAAPTAAPAPRPAPPPRPRADPAGRARPAAAVSSSTSAPARAAGRLQRRRRARAPRAGRARRAAHGRQQRLRRRRRRRAAARWVRASSRPTVSCWPCTSSSSVAELAQHADAGRLVVDEGAAAAVGGQLPAQHQVLARVVGQALARRAAPRPGWSGGGAKTAVATACAAPRPHQARRRRARRWPAPARPRMIDLPAPVSPVSAVRPGPDGQVQRLDQHHVADAEADQHGGAGQPTRAADQPPPSRPRRAAPARRGARRRRAGRGSVSRRVGVGVPGVAGVVVAEHRAVALRASSIRPSVR